MSQRQHAHNLLDQGLHVFPLDHPEHPQCVALHGPSNPCDGQRGKHPAVKWGTWAVAVTHQQLDIAWAKHRGLHNIAVACGPSALVVLDEDAPGELDKWAVTYGVDLPDTYTVTTGRTAGGRHLYYRWDHTGQAITNNAKAMDGFKIDVRGDGGYVVAEHSQHQTGAVYTGNGLPIAPLPPEVAALLLAGKPKADNNTSEMAAGETWEKVSDPADPNTARIPSGGRHQALIGYAGRLRNKGLDYREALPVYRQRWLLCEQPTGQMPEAKHHSPDCPYPVTWAEAQAKLRDVFERYAAGQPEAENTAEGAEATTWEAFDLGPWLSGEHVSPQPSVGISRADGQKLLYPGREHLVFGETEAGKSWFALECVAVEIRMGRDVVYIHYEEGDPGSTIERLQLLAVTPEQIRQHLRFVAPARPVRGTWLEPLLSPPPALVIHDGVNEAMSLHGDDTNATDGAATFRRTIIKPFLAVGAASLSCDHVVKNSDNRGRYAIGSGHKVNAIDGAAFLMENIEPFGRGLRGASAVYVTKDRPGQLRAHGRPTGIPGKTLIGVLAVDATADSEDFLVFWPPKAEAASAVEAGEPMGDVICGLIAAMAGKEVGTLRTLLAELRNSGHQFRDTAVRDTLDDLVAVGRLVEFAGKRNAVGYRLSTASRGSSETTAAATASASASPIGGEAGSSGSASASEAVGSSGKQSCSDCDAELLSAQSRSGGQCERCRLDAQAGE